MNQGLTYGKFVNNKKQLINGNDTAFSIENIGK